MGVGWVGGMANSAKAKGAADAAGLNLVFRGMMDVEHNW